MVLDLGSLNSSLSSSSITTLFSLESTGAGDWRATVVKAGSALIVVNVDETVVVSSVFTKMPSIDISADFVVDTLVEVGVDSVVLPSNANAAVVDSTVVESVCFTVASAVVDSSVITVIVVVKIVVDADVVVGILLVVVIIVVVNGFNCVVVFVVFVVVVVVIVNSSFTSTSGLIVDKFMKVVVSGTEVVETVTVWISLYFLVVVVCLGSVSLSSNSWVPSSIIGKSSSDNESAEEGLTLSGISLLSILGLLPRFDTISSIISLTFSATWLVPSTWLVSGVITTSITVSWLTFLLLTVVWITVDVVTGVVVVVLTSIIGGSMLKSANENSKS